MKRHETNNRKPFVVFAVMCVVLLVWSDMLLGETLPKLVFKDVAQLGWMHANGIDTHRKLVGHWTFNEGEGFVANDSSGNGNPGAIHNTDWTDDAVNGSGLLFSGDNDDVAFSNLNGASFPANGSLSFWIKGDFRYQYNKSVFDRWDDDRHLFIRTYNQDCTQGLQICFQGTNGSYGFGKTVNLEKNRWHHVAIVWDTENDKGYVYVDGSLKHADAINDAAWIPDQQTARLGGGLKGIIDEVRIYGNALKESDIKQIFREDSRSPLISFSAGPNPAAWEGGTTLSWVTVDDDVTCEASGDWSGPKSALGTSRITNIVTDKRFTLTCRNNKGDSSAKAIAVAVNPDFSRIGDHPRLYIDPGKIESIKSKLGEKPYSRFWPYIKEKADAYVEETPLSRLSDYSDARAVGDKLPFMALAYLLTGEGKYLAGAEKWMNAISSYSDDAWGNDLTSAHILFGMSIAYDWLYSSFSDENRQVYRKKMAAHAAIKYNALVGNDKAWWAVRYLQNHNYHNAMSIAVAGMALFGEEEAAGTWMVAADENFDRVLSLLSPDGASHEGISYGRYGMEALLKYFSATALLSGFDRVLSNPFFQNSVAYRLHASLPGYRYNADYADSSSTEYNSSGSVLRGLAGIFKDGYAQWLAERIDGARGSATKYSWLDLLWYDETVASMAPDSLPTYRYFDNLGIFISRSDWTNDAVWCLFKAGPPQGKLAESMGVYAGSHIHPDEGTFMLWSQGEWLVHDDGQNHMKRTESHNLLLFNGIGQLGDGGEWFNSDAIAATRGTAEISHVDLTDGYQYLVADLEHIYRPEADLKKWQRSFIFLADGFVIIKDDVALNVPGKIENLAHVASNAEKINTQSVCLLNPASSIVAQDSSDNGNYDMFSNAVESTDAVKGAALNLSKSTDYIDFPDFNNSYFPTPGSISFWVKGDFTDPINYQQGVFDRWDDDRHIYARSYNKYGTTGLQISFQAEDGACVLLDGSIGVNLTNDAWHHIVICWDTVHHMAYVYADGALVASDTITDPSWAPDQQTARIGGGFIGAVDEVIFYNKVLRPEEVQDLYQLQLVTDGLAGYWSFDAYDSGKKFVMHQLFPDSAPLQLDRYSIASNERSAPGNGHYEGMLVSSIIDGQKAGSFVTLFGPNDNDDYKVTYEENANVLKIEKDNTKVTTIDFSNKEIFLR